MKTVFVILTLLVSAGRWQHRYLYLHEPTGLIAVDHSAGALFVGAIISAVKGHGLLVEVFLGAAIIAAVLSFGLASRYWARVKAANDAEVARATGRADAREGAVA